MLMERMAVVGRVRNHESIIPTTSFKLSACLILRCLPIPAPIIVPTDIYVVDTGMPYPNNR